MAREGISDLGEGIGEYLHQANDFHANRSNQQGNAMETYITKKVKSKNRRFNSINNRKNNFTDKHAISVIAKEYRNQSDGDE